jgi:DNA repair protein RadC
MSIEDLRKITGIGKAKASAICASFELGRRRSLLDSLSMDKITRSTDVYEIFKSVMQDIPYEEFWMIMLNKANKVLAKVKISEGGISGTVVDPKKIFKIALDHHASSIILGHNHPSGNIQPSEPDHKITKKIKDAGMMLDMAVLDHIIVGDEKYYSFADEGTL